MKLKLFVVTFFVLLSSISMAQNKNFVQRCEGTWQGTMFMYAYGNLRDSVTIRLTVQPFAGEAGHWYWKTEYLSEKMPMTKDYTLVQQSDYVFELDEGDGVTLLNYVHGNKMHSLFEVAKTWLTASYELVNESLIFEVTSGTKSKDKSKGVTNYTVDFIQRATLVKAQP